MSKIRREVRRVVSQVGRHLRGGSLVPTGRCRRANKPKALRDRPELEIDSPLEFLALAVAARSPDFFFVQVGAFDGLFQDSLPSLARRHGWRGVLVEPQPGAFKRLCENFSEDADRLAFENVAISPTPGEMTFYTTRDQSSHVASFDRGNLIRRGVDPSNILETRVPTATVRELLDRRQQPHAHLVQIDAEGYDAHIVRSLDLDQDKPEIIRYEHLNLVENERSSLIDYLAGYGYRFLLEDSDTIAYRG